MTVNGVRLGALYRIRDERALTADPLPLLSVSQTRGVVPRAELMGDTGRADDLSNYKVCRTADIVINRMSAYNGAIGVSRADGLVSPDYLVLEATPAGDPDFITYWLRSALGQFEIARRLRGIGTPGTAQVRTPRVNESDLRLISADFPTRSTQAIIADFLDCETAQIDTLIAKQEQLIATLAERRQGLVDLAFAESAATRRLQVGRLLRVRPTYGVLVPRYVDADRGVPLVRVGDLEELAPDSPLRQIAVNQSAEYSRTILTGGEVLLGVVGNMGRAVVAPDWLEGANVVRAIAVLRCLEPSHAPLLAAWFSSTHFLNQAELATSGDSVQPTLGMGDLAHFAIHWPANESAVSDTWRDLHAEMAGIDSLIAKAERFIALTHERRAALITAAVTGVVSPRA